MTKEIKEAWIKELTTTNAPQVYGEFYKKSKGQDCYCFLGLLLKVAREFGIKLEETEQIPWIEKQTKMEFKTLYDLNDRQHKSFLELADWVKENIPVEGQTIV
jgi:hypothetical protein